MMTSSLIRSVAFALAMSVSAVLAAAWTPSHFIADDKPRIDLKQVFPKRLGEWEVDPHVIPLQPNMQLQQVIEATYDQTLAYTYRNPTGQRVMLSIAYGRNQHEGMNTHRPEICYPAQGFPLKTSSRSSTEAFGDQPILVTRVVAGRAERNEPITYWVIVGDEVTTFGRSHKLTTLKYGLLGKIPDGMLIRVSSIDPDNERAFALQTAFIKDMLASMSPDSRRLLLGSSLRS